MVRPTILLVGAGGHAISCIDVIEQHGKFEIAGIIGSASEIGSTVLGYRVLGTDEELPSLGARYGSVLIAVGQIKTPDTRVRLFAQLTEMGYRLATIVSPRAYVSPRATLGAGSIVMHGAIVNARASVGRNCIVNSMALVEHDAIVSDHCHIATAAVVNGGATVGAGTFVGSHSSLRQGVTVGERCVIGLGQRVLADCPSGTSMPPRAET
jgi:sugar O-acyltransferase (sialic acid O-acetyltransferase NeuD family)